MNVKKITLVQFGMVISLMPIATLSFLAPDKYQWSFVLLILCGLIPWLRALFSRSRMPVAIEPVTLMVLLVMFYYLAYPLVILYVAGEDLLLAKITDGGYSIVLTSGMGTLSLLSFYFGYFPYSFFKPKSVRKLSPNTLFVMSGFLGLLGLLNSLLFLPVYILWLPAYILLTVALAYKGHFKRTGGAVLFLMVFFIVAFGYLTFNDERRELGAMLIASGVMYSYFVRPIRFLYVAIAIPLVIIVAFGVGVKRGGGKFDVSMLSSFVNVYSVDYMLRQIDIGVVYPDQAQLYTAVPDSEPLLYGKTLSKPLFWVIPRNIWPDKPETVSRLFAKVFDPPFYDVGGSRPPSLIGELYWNFHILGVVLGFFTIGRIARRISPEFYPKLTRRPEDIGFSALVLSQTISLFRGSIATVILMLFISLIAYFSAIRFASIAYHGRQK